MSNDDGNKPNTRNTKPPPEGHCLVEITTTTRRVYAPRREDGIGDENEAPVEVPEPEEPDHQAELEDCGCDPDDDE